MGRSLKPYDNDHYQVDSHSLPYQKQNSFCNNRGVIRLYGHLKPLRIKGYKKHGLRQILKLFDLPEKMSKATVLPYWRSGL